MSNTEQENEVSFTLPSNPKDREKIKTMLGVVVGEMRMIDDRKQSIKETIAALHEEFAIPKKVLTKLARTMFKDDYQDVLHESTLFDTFWEGIIETNHNSSTTKVDEVKEDEEGE